jgi:hypothetical protein
MIFIKYRIERKNLKPGVTYSVYQFMYISYIVRWLIGGYGYAYGGVRADTTHAA